MLAAMGAFFFEHGPVLSVLLPGVSAVFFLLMGDGGEGAGAQADTSGRCVRWSRAGALVSVVAGLLMAVGLVYEASAGAIRVYELGQWPAPFGIVLVVDRLSALMVLLNYLVALPVLWYAVGGWDVRGRYFHALFQFELMGLCGAFLTGDLFNLFVFFEVLLVASYVLLVHGQGRARLAAGLHYVVLNLLASGLFLLGLALVYGVTGTLNMADVALRMAALEGDGAVLGRVAAWLLLLVFGFKAALVPFYFWLPSAYARACAPVAALFAIMTKVGVYAIVRVHWSMLGQQAGELAWVTQDGLLAVALLSSVVGAMGALGAHRLGGLLAYLTVSSVGTVLMGVALGAALPLSAALYYMLQSTVVLAGLFLLVELIAAQRGRVGDELRPAAAVREPVALGFLMMFGAASAAGLPPLPGFLGKLMMLQGSSGLSAQAWVWAVLLGVGFLTLLGLARAGVVMFWHVQPDEAHLQPGAGRSGSLLCAVWVLMGLALALAVWAAPVKRYTDAAAAQLADQSAYARAVLGSASGAGSSGFVRPYTGGLLPPSGAPGQRATQQGQQDKEESGR